MKIYEQMTLGDLIAALEAAGDTEVRGLGVEIESYRGFYERNSIEAAPDAVQIARELAGVYADQIGKAIYGYKGGNYFVSEGENVYLAGYGDTGPAICGLVPAADGVLEPLLVEVSLW